MNIKSLLLGSAAALAAVSGAQAADAIVAAEPEPVEYVRVCDAFGTGYFYIPGTETCLKVGGYVRFQVDAGDQARDLGAGVVRRANGTDQGGNGDNWDAFTRGRLAVTAKSDTELGTLTSFIAIHAEAGEDATSVVTDPFYFDEVYLQLGGFKAGSFLTWWDKGINGESDTNGQYTRSNAIQYTYTGSAFSAGIQLDEISRAFGSGSQGVGVEGIVSGKFGGVSVDLLGSYDVDAEEGAIRALVSAAIGPGTLQALAVWSSGEGSAGALNAQQVYWNISEWSLAASYAFKATDKLTITPGAQYFWNSSAGPGDFRGDDFWRAGVTLDYAIVSGLALKVSAQYEDKSRNAGTNGLVNASVSNDRNSDRWFGFVRLQRDF